MAYKVKVVEVAGNAADLESTIQAAIDGLTIAAGSEPSIAVTGQGARKKAFILYRDS